MLSSSFENLVAIAKHLPEDVIITDAEMKVQYVNNAYLEHTGYNLLECLGNKPTFLSGPSANIEELIEISKKMALQQAFAAELTNYKKNGEAFRNRIRFVPIFDNNDKLLHYYSIQQDITETYQNQLIANRIFDDGMHPTCFTRTDGKVLKANKKFCKMVELSSDQLVGQKLDAIFKLVHKKTNEFKFHLLENNEEQEDDYSVYEYITKSNKKLILRTALKEIDLLGSTYCYCVFENVTELSNRQHLIEQQKKLIQGYFSSSAEGIYIINKQGIVLGFNKYASNATIELFGKPVELGQPFEELIKLPSVARLFHKNLLKAFGGECLEHEAHYDISLTGAPQWLQIRYQPINNESNQVEAVSLAIRSIEKEKQAQLLISKQSEQLEHIARINSHDIRGPLATLLGLVNLIAIDNKNNHNVNLYVTKIKTAAEKLDGVIRAIVRKSEV